MIPSEYLELLINFSNRNDDGDLVLDEKAPDEVVKVAKEFNWKPYDKLENKVFEL